MIDTRCRTAHTDEHAQFRSRAIRRHVAGELTPEEGSAAKAWHTDLQFEAADTVLQLHGGAGYMNEYPIARFWRDARVPRICGGTNEIMKEIVGRALSAV
jgi:acyl-CoA dehydrogenase